MQLQTLVLIASPNTEAVPPEISDLTLWFWFWVKILSYWRDVDLDPVSLQWLFHWCLPREAVQCVVILKNGTGFQMKPLSDGAVLDHLPLDLTCLSLPLKEHGTHLCCTDQGFWVKYCPLVVTLLLSVTDPSVDAPSWLFCSVLCFVSSSPVFRMSAKWKSINTFDKKKKNSGFIDCIIYSFIKQIIDVTLPCVGLKTPRVL